MAKTENLPIIAISGCSCSGKTTLAERLHAILPNSALIQQDKFYKLDKDIPIDLETKYDNWDTPEAILMEDFFNAIVEATNSSAIESSESKQSIVEDLEIKGQILNQLRQKYKEGVVIVEGFLYFQEPKFQKIFDKSIFIWANYSTLLQRREAREGYVTKEGFWKDPPNYFEKVVWPSFKQFYQPFLNLNREDENNICLKNEGEREFKFDVVITEPPKSKCQSLDDLIKILLEK